MAGDDRATGWADELQTAFDHHVVQSLQRPESEDTADGGSWAGPGAGINVVVVQEASDCGQFLSSVLNWFTGGPNLLVIGWSRFDLHSWRKRMRQLYICRGRSQGECWCRWEDEWSCPGGKGEARGLFCRRTSAEDKTVSSAGHSRRSIVFEEPVMLVLANHQRGKEVGHTLEVMFISLELRALSLDKKRSGDSPERFNKDNVGCIIAHTAPAYHAGEVQAKESAHPIR